MSAKKIMFLNMMPSDKIKKECDEEDAVTCKACGKGFASAVALDNHARLEHLAQYAAGEQLAAPRTQSKAKIRAEKKNQIKLKTQELISSMSPTNLTSFASPDVSYIIIKTEHDETQQERGEGPARGAKKRERAEKGPKKDPMPISGPFECLQPSTLVADGTCHQIFFSCCEYSLHHRDEHTRRRKGLRCQVCERPLLAEPYACETCGIGFESSSALSEHTSAAHAKLKPYRCGACGKRFTQQGGLQQHTRMHTGDRPYSCTFCPKAFTQKSGLDQHLRIHTKVRPYRCVVCGKSFCQSIHLKQHMRTHTHVAPFRCGLCGKRFKQSSHLNYHLRGHAGAGAGAGEQASEQKTQVISYGGELYIQEEDGEEYSEVTFEEEIQQEQEGAVEEEQSVEETVEEECVMGDYVEGSDIA